MLILLLSLFISAKEPIKVAVIDSGINVKHLKNINFCNKSWNKSFIDNNINDNLEHGTNVTGLIKKYAGNANYCFIIVKVWGNFRNTNAETAYIKGLEYATSLKPDIINLSGGGYGLKEKERDVIIKYLNSGGTLINAAGNEREFLPKNDCKWYPGCYDSRIIVIGNMSESSNYGPRVNFVLNGEEQTAFNITMSGSSQAAAIFTGMVVHKWKTKKKNFSK